ncbi:MAG TPA: chromate efflux transporter [Pseudolysinimonas sp.]|jgi:chromate transporter|nr:chromate efflux transporter [Pseudolysinimonas sp.]
MSAPADAAQRRPGEVLAAFAKLGVTSFGGPIAHLGFFRAELVERRRWLSEKDYADLVALCQFLPGPASSQVGFALGLARGGLLGALAAFAAFTLPSAILLVAFAFGASALGGPIAAAVLAGLKVVAVAIVAQAVLGMARTLTPDARRAIIAAVAAAMALLLPGAWGQIGAILLGGVAGALLCRDDDGAPGGGLRFGVPRWVGAVCLAVFAVLLVGLPVAASVTGAQGLAVFDAFYRSGALVFGGGHVVLPLLQTAVVEPGWVDQGTFLTGYGAAQAVPGPLFTFAAFLGAALQVEPNGIAGAAVGLVGIFLPGFLLLVGVLPFWDGLRGRRTVRSVMRGANAAVVGILAAALYNPIFVTAVTGAAQFALALVCFVLLVAVRLPPWAVVIAGAAGGLVIGLTGV